MNFAAVMPFQFHLDILDYICKGILIGIVASAPMGPVGVLCIQRTLNKGRWYGFITGVGATISDFIYAISKKNCNVFNTRIRRDDPVYLRGRDKYLELAFQYWCLAL